MTSFDHVRRSDGERVGTIEMTDDGLFVPVDLLGRRRGEPMELDEAEALLERIGLTMLASDWVFTTDDGRESAVRVVEVHPDHVVVAPRLDSESVAGGVDLTHRTAVPLPTDRLREV